MHVYLLLIRTGILGTAKLTIWLDCSVYHCTSIGAYMSPSPVHHDQAWVFPFLRFFFYLFNFLLFSLSSCTWWSFTRVLKYFQFARQNLYLWVKGLGFKIDIVQIFLLFSVSRFLFVSFPLSNIRELGVGVRIYWGVTHLFKNAARLKTVSTWVL